MRGARGRHSTRLWCETFIVDLPEFLNTAGFWTPVAVALVAVFGTRMTARPALKDIGLKRRLDAAKRFTELAERSGNAKGNVA